MTTFYSHSTKDKNGKRFGTKHLQNHTKGVKDKAIQSFHAQGEYLNFSIGAEKLKHYIEETCRFHDLGKYTEFFQQYLLGDEEAAKELGTLKNHAHIGAFALLNYLQQHSASKSAFLAFYAVLRHHGNLENFNELHIHTQMKEDNFIAEFNKKQCKSLLLSASQITDEISFAEISTLLFLPQSKPFRLQAKDFSVKCPSIEHYFLLNYLFSLLIESDKLDASDTKQYELRELPEKVVDRLLEEREKAAPPTPDNPQNDLRTSLRKGVIERLRKLSDDDLRTQRLYTLTAPTGIGKTLTALDFALQLRERLFALEGRHSQIIYALPFINIIEQGLNEYQQALGDDVRVLAHYQYADIFSVPINNVQNASDEQHYNRQAMTLDTWQADVVITSFVQLLETLIGWRNKILKKFHHLAGSIIILDEVQALRGEYYPLVGAALYYCAEFLNARILLMTATKPLVFTLAEQHIVHKDTTSRLTSCSALELAGTEQEVESLFQQFERTCIIPILESPLETSSDFTTLFREKWSSDISCLIVCNTVKRSLELFAAVEKFRQSKHLENPLYYLSTNVVPAHRLKRIEAIKADITAKKAPILIATQTVEAGVDLDFDMGFRDIGPLSSIIQVAGRINRNNSPEKQRAPLYIVDFKDCLKVYDSITYHATINLLTAFARQSPEGISERDYLSLSNLYFTELGEKIGTMQEGIKIFDAMEKLRYEGKKTPTTSFVSDFEVIKEQGDVVSVFIVLPEAQEAKQAFERLFEKGLNDVEYGKRRLEFARHKQTFHQHIIAVPRNQTELLQARNWYLSDKTTLYVPTENVATCYDLMTGFIRTNTYNTHIML